MDFFYIDMIHMSLMKWVWLVPIILLLLRAVGCIVPFVVTLVTEHLASILLHEVVMVGAIVASMIVVVSFSRVVVIVTLMAIMVVAISFMVLTSIPTIAMVIVATKLVMSRVTIPFIGCAWFLVRH